MRVNSRVLTEKSDILGNIQIPNCPSQFRLVAENLMMLATKPGYAVGKYINITEMDKILTIDYWQEYDGLPPLGHGFLIDKEWFMKKSTPADLISRARRWLQEHNYLIIPEEIQLRASGASEKWRQSISR